MRRTHAAAECTAATWWLAAGLALVASVSCAQVITHLVSSPSGAIFNKGDFVFTAAKPNGKPDLAEFLAFQAHLDRYRASTDHLDRLLYGDASDEVLNRPLPDLLSETASADGLPPYKPKRYRPSVVISPAHKGLSPSDWMELPEPPPDDPSQHELPVSAQPLDLDHKVDSVALPTCTSPLEFSMSDFQHLRSVALRDSLMLPRETELASVWPFLYARVRKSGPSLSLKTLGLKLRDDLKANSTSWVHLNFAATYWRMMGNATQAIECLRRALHYSPWHYRDVSLVALANVLHLAKANLDALIVINGAVEVANTTYATHYIRGNILADLGRLHFARIEYLKAVEIRPDLFAAQEMLAATTGEIIRQAKTNQVEKEIALRQRSMVLPPEITWMDFDYTTAQGLCYGVTCKEHAQCNTVDGQCHCDEGYLAEDGECVPDELCVGVTCKSNSGCRGGKCYCLLGFSVVNNECMPEPCATVRCVENAVCNRQTGRCECSDPFVQNGNECLPKDCAFVQCRAHAFCKKASCYCRTGYHNSNNGCQKDPNCFKPNCPINSVCDPNDGHCRCRPGYFADILKNQCVTTKPDGPDLSALNVPPTRTAHAAPPVSDHTQLDDWQPPAVCQNALKPPAYNEYASTYMPPSGGPDGLKSLLDFGEPVPVPAAEILLPRCAHFPPTQSMRMLDHVPGVAARSNYDFQRAYLPEVGLKDVGHHLFGMKMHLPEMGHRIKKSLDAHPTSWQRFALAVLFWRGVGNATEAIECARRSLHYAPLDKSDSVLLSLANIFLRTNRLDDAAQCAEMTFDIENSPTVISHFTLANIRAAQGRYDDAASHYEAAIKLQPDFELSQKSLLNVRCIQLERLHDQVVTMKRVAKQKTLAMHELHGSEAYNLRDQLNVIESILTNDDPHEGKDHLWRQLKDVSSQLDVVLGHSTPQDQNQVQLEPGQTLDTLLSETEVSIAPQHKLAEDIEPEVQTCSAGDCEDDLKKSDANGSALKLTDTNAAGKNEDEKVVVVEYPKTPSLPNLIAAVQDMMAQDHPRTHLHQPFDSSDWPNADVCATVDKNPVFYPSLLDFWHKGIEVRDLVDTSMPSLKRDRRPMCHKLPLPSGKMHRLEHLKGVAERNKLGIYRDDAIANMLANSLRINPTGNGTMQMKAMRVAMYRSLQENRTSWAALSLAGMYWRAVGNATQAVECFRRGFFFAPSVYKDIALVSLANILHQAGYSVDALTIMQMAIQVSPKTPVTHLTMANILASLGDRGLDEAGFFYETTLRLEPTNDVALRRLTKVRCRQIALAQTQPQPSLDP